MKYVFFGTSEFSVTILEILYQNNFIPDLIITTPDRPKGRGLKLKPNPVKIWAQKNNIKFIEPEKLTRYVLPVTHYDLFIIAAYGKIIPKEILEIPEGGTLNVHPSLLPKFRGPSPIQSFILSGEKETGVTIILADEKVDHGPIIAKSEIFNAESETYKELEEKLARLGGNLLVEVLPKFLNGEIKPQEQNHSEATFTKKITKEDGLIDLEKDPPELIERKIRALNPWPGVYTFINGKRLIITKAKLTDSGLKILYIKPEGKKEINLKDYLRGNPNRFLERYL